MNFINSFKFILLILGIGGNLSLVLADVNSSTNTEVTANKNNEQYINSQQEANFRVLANMIDQLHNSNYQIIFSSFSSGEIINYNFTHASFRNQEVAEIYNLEGEKNTIILKDGTVSYVESKETIKANKIIDVLPTIFNLNDIEQIKQEYSLSKLGKKRVANIEGDLYLLKNKNNSTYQLNITIDPQTILPLQIDKHDDNTIIQSYKVLYLTSGINSDWLNKIISFVPFAKSLENNQNLTLNTINPDINRVLEESIKINWLPEGFVLINNGIVNINIASGIQKYYSYYYSDGIFSFSLYFNPEFKGETHYHFDNGETNIYVYSFNNREINLFGDLPLTTFKRIMNSINVIQDGNEVKTHHRTGYGKQLSID